MAKKLKIKIGRSYVQKLIRYWQEHGNSWVRLFIMDDAKKGAFLNFKFHKVVQQRIAGEMGVFITVHSMFS